MIISTAVNIIMWILWVGLVISNRVDATTYPNCSSPISDTWLKIELDTTNGLLRSFQSNILAVDLNGYLYVSGMNNISHVIYEFVNHKVNIVVKSDVIEHNISTSTPIAINSLNELYYIDINSNSIRRVNISNSLDNTLCVQIEGIVTDIIFDSHDILYIAVSHNIVMLSSCSSVGKIVAHLPAPIVCLAIDVDDNLYISTSASIYKYVLDSTCAITKLIRFIPKPSYPTITSIATNMHVHVENKMSSDPVYELKAISIDKSQHILYAIISNDQDINRIVAVDLHSKSINTFAMMSARNIVSVNGWVYIIEKITNIIYGYHKHDGMLVSHVPTIEPTYYPQLLPTDKPSRKPTAGKPTHYPTVGMPTMYPTEIIILPPTLHPTEESPTMYPTESINIEDTISPTESIAQPTTFPTAGNPTIYPTMLPPTRYPTPSSE